MRSDGVVYSEMSFDVTLARRLGSSWPALADVLRDVISPHRRALMISPTIGISRNQPADELFAEFVQALRSGFFSCIDIYGREDCRSIDQYRPYIMAAENAGLKKKLHVGEIGGAGAVMREAAYMRPHEVQHGIGAAADRRVMSFLVDNDIVCNVCPGSNIALGLARDYASHPLRVMFDAGVRVTLATDDFAVFALSLSQEYLNLHRQGGFAAEELEIIRRNGLAAQRDFLKGRFYRDDRI